MQETAYERQLDKEDTKYFHRMACGVTLHLKPILFFLSKEFVVTEIKYEFWKDGVLEQRSSGLDNIFTYEMSGDGSWRIYLTNEGLKFFGDYLIINQCHPYTCKPESYKE